jgi:catechol 1,2-dioxygenase
MTKNQKVIDVFETVIVKFREIIREHELDHDDYHALVHWMDELGRAGEIPLFMDVFLETHALKEMYANVKGTEPTILGPYYIENQQEISNPGKLPMRSDEDGEKFIFSGTVSDVDGNPLPKTKVDMWQADNTGEYSYFDDTIPEGNLRGVFYTDDEGKFEVETIVPKGYSVPTSGPTGHFLNWIDHHPHRPAHLHFLFKPTNGDKLISQVYFEGDEYLEDDVATGVRGSLIIKLEDAGDHKKAHLDFQLRLSDKPSYALN